MAKEQIIDEIDRLADGNTPPTSIIYNSESQFSLTPFYRHFDRWRKGVKAAGYDPSKIPNNRFDYGPQPSVDSETIIEEIHRLADDEIPPKATEFSENARISITPVRRVFGSFTAALREAGYDPHVELNVSKEELLDEIDRLADGDIPPTASKFSTDAKYSDWSVYDRFGSWQTAVREAGYEPRIWRLSSEELLRELRTTCDDVVSLPVTEIDTKSCVGAYFGQFGTWWEATVRAGLKPYHRRPLSPRQWERMFVAATEQQKPEYQLTALLIQLTGLRVDLIRQFSKEWVTYQAGEVLVTIPGSVTGSGKRWTFRVPSAVTMIDGSTKETDVLGLVKWHFDNKDTDGIRVNPEHVVAKVAADAGLSDREYMDHDGRRKIVPRVRPADLWFSGGVRMACNGASRQRIRRHLGLDHIGWHATVEQIFLWCHIYIYGFDHPDSDVGGMYLGPDLGDVREIESEAN